MPLSATDYVEILRLLRSNVSEALGPLDDRIVSDFP